MKTVIIFLLSIILVESSLPNNVEIYEIRENSNTGQMYLTRTGNRYRPQQSPLLKLFRPYYGPSTAPIGRFTRDVIEQLRDILPKRTKRNNLKKRNRSSFPSLQILGLASASQSTESDSNENQFFDETRNSNLKIHWNKKLAKKLNANKLNLGQNLLPVLRTNNEDRTAAPMHHRPYDDNSD